MELGFSHSCIVRGSLDLVDEKQSRIAQHGEVNCAILGTSGSNPIFRMGCYCSNLEYICTTDITPNNNTGANIAQHGSGVSFLDEAGKSWLLTFSNEIEGIEFCGHITVAMFGVSSQPQTRLTVLDVSKGAGRSALLGDTVTIRHQSWIVDCDSSLRGVPTLGSKLEASPSIRVQLMSDTMVNDNGFSCSLMGMRVGQKRFTIIPPECAPGLAVPLCRCVFVELLSIDATYGESNPVFANKHVQRPESELRDELLALKKSLLRFKADLCSVADRIETNSRKATPKTLAAAQVQFSLFSLLRECEAKKHEVSDKDAVLRVRREQNSDLEQRLQRTTSTMDALCAERTLNHASRNDNKLEGDRRIIDLQRQCAQLQLDVDDLSSSLHAVQQLLEVNQEEERDERRKLPGVAADAQSLEYSLTLIRTELSDQRAKCKYLENKSESVLDELNRLQDDALSMDREICERKSTIESDRRRYESLLGDEQGKSSLEIRTLRAELADDLVTHQQQCELECKQTAKGNYQEGFLQGLEDGSAQAILNGDVAAQEQLLAEQRNHAELSALRARVRSSQEELWADEKRLNPQVASLRQSVDELVSQTTAIAAEAKELDQHFQAQDEELFRELSAQILAMPSSTYLSPQLLGCLVRASGSRKGMDSRTQLGESTKHAHVLEEQEHSEIVAWVRARVYNQPSSVPYWRYLFSDPSGSCF